MRQTIIYTGLTYSSRITLPQSTAGIYQHMKILKRIQTWYTGLIESSQMKSRLVVVWITAVFFKMFIHLV